MSIILLSIFFHFYHQSVAFSIPCPGLILCSCNFHQLPPMPTHCPYFEPSADWLDTFEKWKLEAADRPSLKLLNLHRENLNCLVANLNIISDINPFSDINPVDRVMCEMNFFFENWHKSLHDFLFHVRFLHSVLSFILLAANVLSWIRLEPVVLHFRVCLLGLAKMKCWELLLTQYLELLEDITSTVYQ